MDKWKKCLPVISETIGCKLKRSYCSHKSCRNGILSEILLMCVFVCDIGRISSKYLKRFRKNYFGIPWVYRRGAFIVDTGSFSLVLYTKIFLCRLLYHNATERQARMECGRFVTKISDICLRWLKAEHDKCKRYLVCCSTHWGMPVGAIRRGLVVCNMLLNQASAEMDEEGMM